MEITEPPMDRDVILLEAKGLRKRFGAREVVRGVDLSAGAGEIVGLLGERWWMPPLRQFRAVLSVLCDLRGGTPRRIGRRWVGLLLSQAVGARER